MYHNWLLVVSWLSQSVQIPSVSGGTLLGERGTFDSFSLLGIGLSFTLYMFQVCCSHVKHNKLHGTTLLHLSPPQPPCMKHAYLTN